MRPRRLLYRCAGILLVAVGLVLLPLPIPLGLACIGGGIVLLRGSGAPRRGRRTRTD